MRKWLYILPEEKGKLSYEKKAICFISGKKTNIILDKMTLSSHKVYQFQLFLYLLISRTSFRSYSYGLKAYPVSLRCM